MAEQDVARLLELAFRDKDTDAARELLAYCLEKQANIVKHLTHETKILEGLARFYQLEAKDTAKGADND